MTPKLLNADWNYWPEKHPADSIWRSSAALGFDGPEGAASVVVFAHRRRQLLR